MFMNMNFQWVSSFPGIMAGWFGLPELEESSRLFPDMFEAARLKTTSQFDCLEMI